ncbi:MAG: BolA family transcriptional regulator [Betaproteobacteria bacterium]|nr:BolA family transcriptional regulator [Betaproteobacteria bacterium]
MTLEPQIRTRLATLRPERVELVDESAKHQGHAGWRPGGNTHWRLSLVSPLFAGKPTLARHRMIYQALGDLMDNPIHALTIDARAPGEKGTDNPGA